MRLDFIDALRGIAAFSVCIQHILGQIFKTTDETHPLFPYIKSTIVDSLNMGRFGVVLFFLISGFIIPYTLKPNATLHNFVISRFCRLYPAYWIALLLTFISAPYLNHVGFTWSQLAANFTMVPKVFRFDEMSGIFWTLFIEILFYVFCAILFSAKKLEEPIVIGLIVLIFNASTPLEILLNKFFHTGIRVQFVLFHLSFLFTGSLLRLAIDKQSKLAWQFSIFALLLFLFSVPVTYGMAFTVNEAIGGLVMNPPIAEVSAYFLAILVFIFAVKYRLPNNKFWIGIGVISYSLYLLHMLSFEMVQKLVQPDSLSTSILFITFSALLSWLLAMLSFRVIELPAIEFGKNLKKL